MAVKGNKMPLTALFYVSEDEKIKELPAVQLHGGEKEGGKFQIQRAE